MPIDWGSREAVFRLLAVAFAVIGKERFKGTYGEMARLFGEPATYDAIQCQFREVSKMAESLRAGKAAIHIRQRSVTTPKPVRRPTHPSSNRDPGDLEVIAQERRCSVPYGAARPDARERASGGAGFLRAVQSSNPARPPQPPPSWTPSPEACTIAHQEEVVTNRPARSVVNGMIESAKPIPDVITRPVQADRSYYRVAPLDSADKVTASFEAELAAHATSPAHPNEAKERVPRTPLGHAEERAEFRKLYSSDSHGTPAERVDKLLSLSSQEHAAERARYRSLYFPDRGKDTTPSRQDISEAQSTTTASAQDRQGLEGEVVMINVAEEHKASGIARSFLENAMKDTGSPAENGVSSLANGTANPAHSYMDHDNRKCLLCDGRRFPGEAFYQHERKSQRHRENLRNERKIAEGNARLERKKQRETRRRKATQKLENGSLLPKVHNSMLGKSNHSPSQDGEQQLREMSTALSPDQPAPGIVPPTQKQESRAPESNETKGNQSIQYPEDAKFLSPSVEKKTVRGQEDGEYAPPPKRKRPMLEPEESASSTQAKKQAKRGNGKGNGGDDVLVQLSTADLDRLLRLHPDIFDTNWNDRMTPAPSGWQAIGPSTSFKPRQPIRNTAYRRQAKSPEEAHDDAYRASPRNYISRFPIYDDSADSDYQEEEDQDEEDEYDEEVMEEEEDWG